MFSPLSDLGNKEFDILESILSDDSFVSIMSKFRSISQSEQSHGYGNADSDAKMFPVQNHAVTARRSPYLVAQRLSPWSRSRSKRLFDCVCVLLSLPLLVPTLLVVALVVWLTSSGPILFLQKRMGRDGRAFTILKFRTMVHDTDKAHHAVTTAGNQRFTLVGAFLRQRKIDELPQLLNVLAGHMSLVGPRPKMREHMLHPLPCHPGITGAATIAFALEEAVLDRVPKHHLETYYHKVILPAKRHLDAEYMARATFLSDFKLIVNSVLRRWDASVMEGLLNSVAFGAEDAMMLSKAAHPEAVSTRASMQLKVDQSAPVKQVSIF
jgi:lipopolysaccharide/colanic/teichoic acid biosynthesis glycosyltransferase